MLSPKQRGMHMFTAGIDNLGRRTLYNHFAYTALHLYGTREVPQSPFFFLIRACIRMSRFETQATVSVR